MEPLQGPQVGRIIVSVKGYPETFAVEREKRELEKAFPYRDSSSKDPKVKASIVSPAWAGSTPQLCLLMKPQAGSQAAATKAHNCVGWPRRTDWKGEVRPVPTGCVGGMTAAYSYLKSARYG